MFFNRRAFVTVDSLRRIFNAAKEQRRERRPKRDGKRAAPKPSVLRLENLEERQLLSAVSPFVGPMPSQSAPLAAESAATVPAVAMPDFSAAEAEGKTWVVTTLNDAVDDSDGVLSLREALAAANDGDAVTFAQPGTIKLSGTQLEITKSIKIDASSVWDAANNAPGITVDGDAKSRVFYITGGEVELIGIKVYNGYIVGNAREHGGGIATDYNINTSLTLENCEISSNKNVNYDGNGGGVALYYGSLTLVNSKVFDNSAHSGGGVFVFRGTVTLTNSTFSGNEASHSGGGILIYEGSLIGTNCEVANNRAYFGGIDSLSAALTFVDSNFFGNVGGGLYSGSSLTLTNCTVSGNSASDQGGIHATGQLSLMNCTVSGNSASGNSSAGCGGIFYNGTHSIKLYNTIISQNFGGDLSADTEHTEFVVEDCLIGIDPQFVCPPVFVDGLLSNPDSLDLHLTSASPAIDRGSNENIAMDFDNDGKPRSVGSRSTVATVDIGAYEYQGTSVGSTEVYEGVVTTSADVCDSRDGLISLREALFYANSGEVITFSPLLNGMTFVLERKDLYITKSLNIDASSLSEKVQISGNGESRVFYALSDLALDNVIITNGKAEGNEQRSRGGGIYSYCGALTLENCVISGNEAYLGGGIYSSDCMLTLTVCTISNNRAWDGGGIYSSNSTLILSECAVSGNETYSLIGPSSGGGIFSSKGTLTLLDCTVSANKVSSHQHYDTDGGGIFSDSVLTMVNCTVSRNEAVFGSGSGIFSYSGGMLTNCIISDNSGGYGIELSLGRTSMTLTNCTVAGNDGGISSYGGYLNLYNTIVALNENVDLVGYVDEYNFGSVVGYNVLTSDVSEITGEKIYTYDPALPLFADAENGDYRLAEDSQAIDLGNNEYAYAAGLDESSTDLAGNARFLGESIDLGAYESESYAKSEQRVVWVGSASFELTNKLQGAVKASARWTSGIESVDLGLFDLPGSLTLDTTQCPDGPLTLTFDYLDASGAVLFTETKTATVINDSSIVVKRGEIVEDETWTADKVWLVVGKLSLPAGRKLTVEEGAAVKFWKGAYIDAASGANVEIKDGSVFTRAEDDEVVGDTNKDGGASLPKIGNAYLRGLGLDGATVSGSAVFKYLSETRSGRMTQSETWFGGKVYRITGDLAVASGATLTLAPGAILKFDPGCSLIVEAGGKLVAKGNAAQPIVFTSLYDDEYGGDLDEDEEKVPSAGDWKQIKALGDAEFDYARVLYSGSDPNNSSDGAVYVAGSGRVVFNNGTVAHSQLAAMHCDGSASLEVNSSIIADAMYGTHNGKYTNCTFDGLTYLCNTNYFYYDGSFTNCVIADVTAGYFSSHTPSYTFNNCLFWNPAGQGPQSFGFVGQNGNIWADPMFRDAANGDYRLRAGSPCIDAADGALAPATDADGAARATDAYSAHTGAPNAEGVYADIGAYEFADYASSSFDLEPIALLAPATAEVGESVLIQWTARNNGSAAVEGTWRDEIWLVSSTGREAFVGTVYTTAKIAAGDVAPCQAKILIPATADDGDWTFAVRVNANRDVFEGVNAGNNEFRAETPTAIRTAALANSGTLALVKGAPKLLRVELPAGQAFFFNGTADHAAALYLRENAAPTSTLYDAKGANYGTGGLALYIAPASEPRTFYLLAETNEAYANIEYAVGTDAALNVVGVSRSSASNLGAPTLSIVGAGLTADVQFELRAGETVVEGTAVAAESGASVAATFDLTGVPAGEYELVAKLNGETATFPNALNVTGEGVGSVLETYLTVPESIRSGRVYQATITYSNVGDADMYAPIFVVTNGDGLIGYRSDETTTDRIMLMGAGASNSAGILRAGETYSVDFYFIPNDSMKIGVSVVDSFDEALQADSYNTDYWTSWGDYYEDLASTLTQYRLRGNTQLDYKSVDEFLLAQKEGGPCSGVSGALTDSATGAGISGAVLQASWGEEDGESEIAVTGENGAFVFNYLPANQEIKFKLLTKGTDLSETSVQTSDADITGLRWTASAFGGVSGRVFCKSGLPFENLFARAVSESGEFAISPIDRWGAYSLDGLKPGKWTVALEGSGLAATAEPVAVEVASGQICAAGTNLTLFDGVLKGRVVDANGMPVSGAFIAVYDSEKELATAVADDEGAYAVYGLNVEEAIVKAQAEGFAPTGTTVSFADATSVEKDITLSAGQKFSGTVSAPSGADAAGCRLVLWDGDAALATAAIDETGAFAFEDMPVGVFRLSVYSPSSAQVWSSDVEITAGHDVVDYAISLSVTTVSGVVSGADGSPVRGATAVLIGEGEEQVYTSRTDEFGQYRFEKVPSGAYSLRLIGFPTVFELQGTGANVVQNITTPYAAQCEIHFTGGDVENLAKEVNIFRYGEDGKLIFVNSTTVYSETAAFYLSQEGRYEFYAQCDGGIFTPLLGAEVAAGSTVVWDAQLGTNALDVTLDASGLPQDAGVVWYLSRVDAKNEICETLESYREAVENFEIAGLIEGNYILEAFVGPYYASAEFAVDGAHKSVALEFERLATVNFNVALPSGAEAKLEDASVALYDSEGNMAAFAFCNEEGQAVLEALPSGSYTAIILNGRYVASTTVTVSGSQTVAAQVELAEAPVAVSGRVTAAGLSVGGVPVYVVDEFGRILGIGYADADGNVEIACLESETGSYTLIVDSEAIQTVETELSVVAGKADFGNVELVLKEQETLAVASMAGQDANYAANVQGGDVESNGVLNTTWMYSDYNVWRQARTNYNNVLNAYRPDVEALTYIDYPDHTCKCTSLQSISDYNKLVDEAKRKYEAFEQSVNAIEPLINEFTLIDTQFTMKSVGGCLAFLALLPALATECAVLTTIGTVGGLGALALSGVDICIQAYRDSLQGDLLLVLNDFHQWFQGVRNRWSLELAEALDERVQNARRSLNRSQTKLTEAQEKLGKLQDQARNEVAWKEEAFRKGEIKSNDGRPKKATSQSINNVQKSITAQNAKVRQKTADLAELTKGYRAVGRVLVIVDGLSNIINSFTDYASIKELENSIWSQIEEADKAQLEAEYSINLARIRKDKVKVCECSPCNCKDLAVPGMWVTGVGETYISVAWTPVQNAASYRTEATRYSSFWNPKWAQVSSTAHTFSGLQKDTTYHMRVKAIAGNGYKSSNWSSVVSAKTKKSEDPNEIVGPIGADYTQVNYGTEEEPNLVIETPNWLAQSSDAQNYRIYFENKASATASAQEVTVDMTMPGEWDWTTFEASTITVGNEIFALTDEYKIGYNVWLFDQASTGAKLRVEQTVDVETGAVRWYLRSWDETTPDHFPTDAYAGFLPPNDKALGTGEGNVAFSVRTKDGLTSGTRIETQATIVFDANGSIDTNVWVNTYDVDAPTASFTDASSSDGRTVELTWSGSDEHSGIGFYDLYYSVDGGATFEPWLSTDASGATFEQVGDYVDYVFKLTPYDAVGNAGSETLLSASINGTVALPPAAPADLTVGEFSSATRSVAVSWTDKSDNETGFLVQYSSDGLHWTDVTVGADAESATLTGLARGVAYTVRVAATNENGASAFVSESFTTPEASTSLDVPSSLRLGEFNEKTGAFVASWGDGSDGADGYLIEASTDGGATWTAVAQAGADATRASVSGAGLTGSFTLRVSAYNGAGASDYAYAQVWNLADFASYKAFALTSPAEGTVVLNGVNKDGSYTALETRELGADFYACVLGRKLTPEDFCIASDAAARLGRIDFVDPVRNNTVSVDAGDGDDLILIGSEVIETTEQIFTRNPYEKVLQYNAERFGEDSALYRNLKAKLDEAYAKMAKIVKTTKTTWGTVSIEGGANVRFIGASSVSVNAGAGDDVVKIDSLRFNYVVTGGEGSDTLSFADASGRANVDLGLTDVWQAAVVGDGGLVKLTDAFEGVVGTVYGDRIVASAKGATVVGNGGADSVTLVGGVNDVQLVGKGQSVIARGSGVYNITLTDANYSTVNVAGVRKESAVTVDVDGDYFTFFGGPSAFDAQIGGDYAIVNGGAALQANVDIIGDYATVTTGQGADSVRIAGDYAIANVGAGSDAVEIVGANANVALGLGDDVLTVSDGASGRVGGSFVNAGAGNDFVYLAGASGKNYVNAGAGNDVVVGGSGADEIYGIAGVNALLGMRGADRIYSGAGRDLIVAAQPVKVEEIEKDDSEALLRFYADLYEDWVVENDLEATLNLVGTQIEPDGDKDSVFAQNLDQVFVDELDGDLVNGKVWKS